MVHVATALRYARSSSTWEQYIQALEWELEWYFHRPFYER